MPLSLLTLNCEEDKHLVLILPFLQKNHFEVICLQEVFEKDLPELAAAANAQAFYVPLALLEKRVWGIAILVRKTIKNITPFHKYYKGNEQEIPTFDHHTPNSVNRAVLNVQFEKEGEKFSITTTHFTWAGGGGVDPEQLKDFPQLEAILEELGETVLCGDFNSPRGKSPVFAQLSQIYTDNIPANVTTTIDGQIHRAGNLQLVVDGLFSSKMYQVEDVAVISGLSDHCGVQSVIICLHDRVAQLVRAPH